MTDIVFGENEGVLLQTTDVYRYSGKREFEVQELYLTNKNLLIIYENNRLDRIPLFSVRVVNGIVQVSQIEDDEYGTVLQLIYTNGRRDLFDLNGFGRKYTTWISAISDAVLSLVNEKSDASSSDIIDVNNAKDEITKHTAKSLCDNCGAEIYVTAKFCPECGTQRKEGNSQRRVVYDGVIHKCPICGDVLDSFKLKCDACGYELRGTKSSAAVQDFVAEIRRLEEIGGCESGIRIATHISTFPIPNTREELLEFFILSASNIDIKAYGFGSSKMPKDDKAITYAYYSKFEQAYRKARSVFGKTEYFDEFNVIYKQKNKDIIRAKKKRRRTILAIILGSVCLFFALLGVILYLAIPAAKENKEKIAQESARLEAIVQEVYMAIEEGDYITAEAKAKSIVFSGPMGQGGYEEKEKWEQIRQELISTIADAMLDEELESYYSSNEEENRQTQPTLTTTTPTEPMTSQEEMFDVVIMIDCEKNLIFSQYDVNVYIDGAMQGTVDHGASKSFSLQLPEGNHTLRFENENNREVDGEEVIHITQNKQFHFSISCTSSNVDVTIAEDELEKTDMGGGAQLSDREIADKYPGSTYTPVTIEKFTFDLPDYWDEEGSKDAYNQYYAEKDGKCVILGIGYPKETDDNYEVSFDGLYADNANMLEMITSVLPDAEVTGYEVFESDYSVKGILYISLHVVLIRHGFRKLQRRGICFVFHQRVTEDGFIFGMRKQTISLEVNIGMTI